MDITAAKGSLEVIRLQIKGLKEASADSSPEPTSRNGLDFRSNQATSFLQIVYC